MVKVSIQALQKYIGLNEWTKNDLCFESGVPIPTLQRIMKGHPCRESTAGKLSKALGVEFEQIIEDWNVNYKK